MNPENTILINYLGGPYDGAREYLDANLLGLEPCQAFEIAHLTRQCFHKYRCEFWDGGDELDVRHIEVERRQPVTAPAT